MPDCVHVSEAFRALTDGAFVFEERGKTDIKSIGLAQTFFLRATSNSTAPPPHCLE